ncbi:hypothetical protein [Paracoccus salsus]|uniref:hypothetical protein n=1 Tax=Paracoccus salsus TaxID=2911061 RepID=UPI001F2D79E1|nr:hypothetical protein [Paracoccus salsus]MCF3972377.1 hypothetical protein [Paracoccus salsus]
MSVWLVAAACFLGAGFITLTAIWLRLRWPLAALSILLAAIATQLFLAARGQNGFHDLAAFRATGFTVIPALAGLAAGLIAAGTRTRRFDWRSPPGALTLLGLAVAGGAAGWTLLL